MANKTRANIKVFIVGLIALNLRQMFDLVAFEK
jgi:hypothetical protein